ncbi:MAG: ArsA family ATPase [Chloroflexi bacterium]|nr:ArsA family ATPase [Chloroflexota bacterium]
MRVILYSGKGGVGKTSAAAATALRCAERGYNTIVLSTDPAHSLSDSFEMRLGPEPTRIGERLWGQEIDVYYSIHKHWNTLQNYMAAVLSWQGVSDLLAEELSAIPGMEEGASLLWIDQHLHRDEFEVIIVDCAPTAETLRLLSLPDVGRYWFEKLFPIGKRATLALGPLARTLLDNVPIPDKATFEAAEGLFDLLGQLHGVLSDPQISSVRLVLNPEKMVIQESQRTYTYLNLYGYLTDAIAANRVMPPEAVDSGYFAAWGEVQAQYLQQIREAFSPLPILMAPFFEREVAGPEMLRRMADALFGDTDPARVLFSGEAHHIDETASGYDLVIPLPFTQKGDVSVLRSGESLTVQVGSYRRNFFLPRTLARLPTGRARFEDRHLKVHFPLEKEEGDGKERGS